MFSSAIPDHYRIDPLRGLESSANREGSNRLRRHASRTLLIQRKFRRETFHRLSRELRFETAGAVLPGRCNRDGVARLSRGVSRGSQFPAVGRRKCGKRRARIRPHWIGGSRH